MAGNEKHVQVLISKEQEMGDFQPSRGKGARITIMEGCPCCSCMVVAKVLMVAQVPQEDLGRICMCICVQTVHL